LLKKHRKKVELKNILGVYYCPQIKKTKLTDAIILKITPRKEHKTILFSNAPYARCQFIKPL